MHQETVYVDYLVHTATVLSVPANLRLCRKCIAILQTLRCSSMLEAPQSDMDMQQHRHHDM